jgi:transposase
MAGQLLDIVPGRGAKLPNEWLENKSEAWRKKVRDGTLDLSGPYRAVFDKMLPKATQVADPFHVVKVGQHQAR